MYQLTATAIIKDQNGIAGRAVHVVQSHLLADSSSTALVEALMDIGSRAAGIELDLLRSDPGNETTHGSLSAKVMRGKLATQLAAEAAADRKVSVEELRRFVRAARAYADRPPQ
jgi:hypothetical protein